MARRSSTLIRRIEGGRRSCDYILLSTGTMPRYGPYVTQRRQGGNKVTADRGLQFIRHLAIPYCSLYDLGYTSLGGTTDTHPNPALKASSSDDAETPAFRPAYELVEDEAERLGRGS